MTSGAGTRRRPISFEVGIPPSLDAKEVMCMNYMTYEQTVMLFMLLITFAGLILSITGNNGQKK